MREERAVSIPLLGGLYGCLHLFWGHTNQKKRLLHWVNGRFGHGLFGLGRFGLSKLFEAIKDYQLL